MGRELTDVQMDKKPNGTMLNAKGVSKDRGQVAPKFAQNSIEAKIYEFECAGKNSAIENGHEKQDTVLVESTSVDNKLPDGKTSISPSSKSANNIHVSHAVTKANIGIETAAVSPNSSANANSSNSPTKSSQGMHGLGGRMATRVIDPQPLIFDHAAQFFTVSDSRFAELVDGWLERGLVREWPGIVGELEVGGRFTPFPFAAPRYVAVNGMRPFADSLLSETSIVNVVRPCWISKLEPFNGMWHLSENAKPRGQFDAIVIAHNGKCANRLLASSGLPLIARQMKRLELNSIWALLAAFEDPLPFAGGTVTFQGAFVKGVDSVSWMGNNSAKLMNSQHDGPHCWTFFSTAAYGKQNKVPQENIPAATAEKVKTGMLAGAEAALGLAKGSLQKPFYTRVQLWGAALPTNTPHTPCIFDPHGRAGICGDWLLGSNMESAAISGMSLAHHIADYFQNGGDSPGEFAIGLQNEFSPVDGHDIGQFSGLNSTGQANNINLPEMVSS